MLLLLLRFQVTSQNETEKNSGGPVAPAISLLYVQGTVVIAGRLREAKNLYLYQWVWSQDLRNDLDSFVFGRNTSFLCFYSLCLASVTDGDRLFRSPSHLQIHAPHSMEPYPLVLDLSSVIRHSNSSGSLDLRGIRGHLPLSLHVDWGLQPFSNHLHPRSESNDYGWINHLTT